MTVQVRHVDIGVGAPKVIVSIMAAEEEAALARAKRIVSAGADICEWRVDQLGDLTRASSILPRLRACLGEMPLLATVRGRAEGGTAELAATELVDLTKQLCTSGQVDLIDVEVDHAGAVEAIQVAKNSGVPVVGSRHILDGCPGRAEMAQLFSAMADLGVDICKLAVQPRTALDVANLLAACAQVSTQLPQPLIAIAMGELGKVSRAAGHIFGSAATFASLDQEASAPGQLAIADLRRIIGSLKVVEQIGSHIAN